MNAPFTTGFAKPAGEAGLIWTHLDRLEQILIAWWGEIPAEDEPAA